VSESEDLWVSGHRVVAIVRPKRKRNQ